jgi:hypothetical protein
MLAYSSNVASAMISLPEFAKDCGSLDRPPQSLAGRVEVVLKAFARFDGVRHDLDRWLRPEEFFFEAVEQAKQPRRRAR